MAPAYLNKEGATHHPGTRGLAYNMILNKISVLGCGLESGQDVSEELKNTVDVFRLK